MTFKLFDKRYIFTGYIKTETAIHIGGAEDVFEPNSIDNVVLKNKNNMPYIPGSSLKGVLRSYLERVLKAREENVCMIPDLCSEKYNKKDDRDKKWKEIQEKYKYNDKEKQKRLSEAMYSEVCCICHLFGSGINAAKLLVRDAKVVEDSFAGFEYRTGVSIDRDKNKARKGALYQIEVVPGDTSFEFKMVLENPDEKDIRNTAFLIKSMENGNIQIGGMTSRGLGEFILEELKISYIDKNNIFDSVFKDENNYIEIDELIKSIG